MNLLIFLTHNFNNEFINTVRKVDKKYNDLEVIILFDISAPYSDSFGSLFQNVRIIRILRATTSYDHKGHSMYITYFRENYDLLDTYNYIWVAENDVYYPNSLKEFMDVHLPFDYDLLVPEYGLRGLNWTHNYLLRGFDKIIHIGVLAVIMRFKSRVLKNLIDNIDRNYWGYLEAIVPRVCLEYGYSIQQFLPQHCGVLTTEPRYPLLALIEKDIIDGTKNYVRDRIYHPIKL